jgi:hypothetical protein
LPSGELRYVAEAIEGRFFWAHEPELTVQQNGPNLIRPDLDANRNSVDLVRPVGHGVRDGLAKDHERELGDLVPLHSKHDEIVAEFVRHERGRVANLGMKRTANLDTPVVSDSALGYRRISMYAFPSVDAGSSNR